jgi:hypothetical protein
MDRGIDDRGEQILAITAPELAALGATTDAGILDLRVVFTIARAGTAALGTWADHDLVDKVFATAALIEDFGDFADHRWIQFTKHLHHHRFVLSGRLRLDDCLAMRAALRRGGNRLGATPTFHD